MRTPTLVSTQKRRLQATIEGRVQGVSFRYYTARRAKELKLHGWVRNRPDGTVEVEAEGDQEALRELLNFLHRGSPSARVENVDARWAEYQGELAPFTVTH